MHKTFNDIKSGEKIYFCVLELNRVSPWEIDEITVQRIENCFLSSDTTKPLSSIECSPEELQKSTHWMKNSEFIVAIGASKSLLEASIENFILSSGIKLLN